jgi:tetratricopeptide (TPR) repeat protein
LAEDFDARVLMRQAADARNKGDAVEAERVYRYMLSVEPNAHDAAHFLADLLKTVGRTPEAIPIALRTAALLPYSAPHAISVAFLYAHIGDTENAGHWYRRVLRMAREWPPAHWAYALWLLGQCRFEEAWKQYEWGMIDGHRSVRHPSPQWDGSPIPGKRLYLCAEQGMGDMILHLRWLPFIKEYSQARIILELHEPLIDQFADYADEVVVTTHDRQFGAPWDYWIGLPSCPHAMGDLAPPAFNPYVRAKEAVPRTGKRIGYCWRGNAGHANDRARSFGYDEIKPLLVDDAERVNLQFDRGETETGFATPDIGTIDKLVNQIAGCDLIVGCDSLVMNLAGAMGKRGIVLTSAGRDFRWTDDDTCVWYPSVQAIGQNFELPWVQGRADLVERARRAIVATMEKK